MQPLNRFAAALPLYLGQLPIYLIWLAGIVLSVMYRRKYPKVSLLAGIAFVVLLISSLISNYLAMWLPFVLIGSPNRSTILAINALVQSLIQAVAWGLVLVAIFGRRRDGGRAT